MRVAQRMLPAFLCLLTSVPVALASDDDPPKDEPSAPLASPDATKAASLMMSPAVACRSIDGFEDYEALPAAALTAHEKLLVYYRPLNYKIERSGKTNHVHLIQDGRIRRHGEKAVLLHKEKLLDYEYKGEASADLVFLRNTISLKGLMPGEYELDIILRDQLAKTERATQVLPFRVVAVTLPSDDGKSEPTGENPSSKVPARSRLRRASRARVRRPLHP